MVGPKEVGIGEPDSVLESNPPILFQVESVLISDGDTCVAFPFPCSSLGVGMGAAFSFSLSLFIILPLAYLSLHYGYIL